MPQGDCFRIQIFKLCQQLLCPDQTILDVHSIRTLNGAGVAIDATHITNFSRKISEAYDRMMVVAVEIMIREKAQHVRHGHALRTHSFALVAHAAVIRPDLFVH